MTQLLKRYGFGDAAADAAAMLQYVPAGYIAARTEALVQNNSATTNDLAVALHALQQQPATIATSTLQTLVGAAQKAGGQAAAAAPGAVAAVKTSTLGFAIAGGVGVAALLGIALLAKRK